MRPELERAAERVARLTRKRNHATDADRRLRCTRALLIAMKELHRVQWRTDA